MDLVAVHAALGETSRLCIAQRLLHSDATPAELGAELSIPSNLLAHHLRALEAAGVVTRHRSEHDARRSYVSLARGVVRQLVAVGSPPPLTPSRVVFVCTRNSARSKLASSIWRARSRVPTVDAGTTPADRPHALALATARRRGLRLDPTMHHVDDVARAGDLVVTVCDHVHETWPHAPELHWSVPDPVPVGNPDAFDSAADLLLSRIDDLATHLEKEQA